MNTTKSVAVAPVTAAPTPQLVVARGVQRSFGQVKAVRDANVEVAAGKVVALIGPNGCGKTTLMLMLAGLLQPNAGQITVAGKNPATDGAAVRQSVGWMPDILGTWDGMKCVDTLAVMGQAYGVSKEAAVRRGYELLDVVHLAEFADRPARVLSRGQKQRLSLARALVHDPQVLILDEPASGLDPRSRVELRELVRGIAATGKAVLISSHVLSELDEMVDDAIFMSKGATLGDETREMVESARQRYYLRALDLAAATAYLQQQGIAFTPNSTELQLQISAPEVAAETLRNLITAGIAVTAFGPVGSALEQTYMTMNEERR